MLSGKRILVAEHNERIAAGLVDAIIGCDGIALGPTLTTTAAFALILEFPDGAILDANPPGRTDHSGRRALYDKSVLLVIAFPRISKARTHTSPPFSSRRYETVIRTIAAHIRER